MTAFRLKSLNLSAIQLDMESWNREVMLLFSGHMNVKRLLNTVSLAISQWGLLLFFANLTRSVKTSDISTTSPIDICRQKGMFKIDGT